MARPPADLAALVALRRRGDPLADAAVASLREHPQRGESVLDKVRAGASAGDRALARFLDETRALPCWCDVSAHVDGRRAMTRHAPVTFLVLLAGSLVESFAVREGAAVLVGTGRLLRDPRDRVYETASLVHALLAFDMRPGGPAHDALLRVRLLHAYVRRFTRARVDFDVDALGVPINQMDMLHTLLMFSCVLAAGVVALGGRLSGDERRSWCALWRAAGHVLGVDDDVLFRDVDEEHALHALVRRAYDPDDGSRALASAVLGGLANEPPFRLPKPGLEAVSRALLGDALADRFGLRRSRRWALVPAAVARGWRAVDVVERHVPLGVDAGVAGGRAFIELNRVRVLRSMPAADYTFRTA